MKNNLQVLPLLVSNREPLRVIETNDLRSQLAKALKDVPALARSMDRKSLNALCATDRSCYHAVSRHELWRDIWVPILHEAVGPLPATPEWLSDRDVYLSFRGTAVRNWTVPGGRRANCDAIDAAWSNCQRAAGRPTLEDRMALHSLRGSPSHQVRQILRQFWSVTYATLRRSLAPLIFFCLVFAALFGFNATQQER